MSFQPNNSMKVDVAPSGDILLISCPMWANDIVKSLPSVRWQKKLARWAAPVIKQNIVALRNLIAMGGVTATPAVKVALDKYDQQIRMMGKRGKGFPAWYPFKKDSTPRKHQWPALNQGYGLRAFGLWMDMQTGKSFTAITLATAHHMEGDIDGVLVFSKRTLRRNWIEQFNDHCPIPTSIYLPVTEKERQFRAWMDSDNRYKVMVVGWESLSQGRMCELVDAFLDRFKVAIIGDEITYICGEKSTRAKLVVGYGRRSRYNYALAGRPDAMEGPINLFMPYEFLDPNIIGIGDPIAYRNRYAVMGGYQRPIGRSGKTVPTKIIGYQNLEELARLIAPYTYQVMKTELDMPPKPKPKKYVVEITPYQRKIYDTIKKEGVLRLAGSTDEEHVMRNVLETGLRLHQVTGGYAVKPREVRRRGTDGEEKVKIVYDPVELITPEDNPKMQEVCAILEEIGKRKQVLLWAVYMPEILALIKLVRGMGWRVAELHGGIKDHLRQPQVNEFRRGGFDIVIGNASTGGMGFSMPEAGVNMFYNNTFKAIDREQAEDRNYGDGTKEIGVWMDIIANRTFDVTTMKALEQKQDVSAFVRERIKQAIALLDGEEL